MKGIILQEVLLNTVRKEQVAVSVNLLNGQKVTGMVKGFDSFTIIIESEGTQTLIYKHSIASIIPSSYVQLSQKKTAN
ncbi:MAG TPA: RNA chaperone Hfq [Clostridia bacterium]|nr:RNA chaperone Hfq [Clostridia bacterium]